MAKFKPVVEEAANGIRFIIGVIIGVAIGKLLGLVLAVYTVMVLSVIILLWVRAFHGTFVQSEASAIHELREAREVIKQFRERYKNGDTV